jgi:hypothetical protein
MAEKREQKNNGHQFSHHFTPALISVRSASHALARNTATFDTPPTGLGMDFSQPGKIVFV